MGTVRIEYRTGIDLSSRKVLIREGWVAEDDSGPICYWGFIPESLLSDRVFTWFHPVRDMRPFRVPFLRACRQQLAEIRKTYPRVFGSVDPELCHAVRWLEWLGFRRVGEFEVEGKTFHWLELTDGH